jgi:SAM-dependent methyltransferase
MPTKYAANEEFDSYESITYDHAIELVGSDKLVLEFGCSTGYVSRALTQQGCRVVGVEIDPDAAFKARRYCEKVIEGDLDGVDVRKALSGSESFDVLLFGDVLEHLKDPGSVLTWGRGLLKSDGYAVISFPNVAHGSVRLLLLLGVFQYEPTGILDETHLRLFTRASMRQLLATCGYQIEEERAVSRPVDPALVAKVAERLGMSDRLDKLAKFLSDAEVDAYQYVIKAVLNHNGQHWVAEPPRTGRNRFPSFPPGSYPGYICIKGTQLEALETELKEKRDWVKWLGEGIAYRDERILELERALHGIQSHSAYRAYEALKRWLRMGH